MISQQPSNRKNRHGTQHKHNRTSHRPTQRLPRPNMPTPLLKIHMQRRRNDEQTQAQELAQNSFINAK